MTLVRVKVTMEGHKGQILGQNSDLTYFQHVALWGMCKVLQFVNEVNGTAKGYASHMAFIAKKASLNVYATDALIRYDMGVTEKVISRELDDWVPADLESVAMNLGADATYAVRGQLGRHGLGRARGFPEILETSQTGPKTSAGYMTTRRVISQSAAGHISALNVVNRDIAERIAKIRKSPRCLRRLTSADRRQTRTRFLRSEETKMARSTQNYRLKDRVRGSQCDFG